MRKRLLVTIAGATLIASGGLAVAQRMESSPGSTTGAQGSSQREPGGAVRERQPGAMQSPAPGRSGAVEEHRSGQTGAMQGSAQGHTSVFGSTSLSSDQRTRIQQTVANGNIHRVDHVNFSLSVGTRVPHTVTFYDVPERIAYIVPQYRGFKYIAVRDDFAIIDPGSREIVALVPMHSSTPGRSGRSVGSTTLSPNQQTRLHGIIRGGDFRRVDNADFSLSVGARVPDTVTFYHLPETIVDIVPQYRGYDYIVVRDELVIIDPETLEIVAVLPV